MSTLEPPRPGDTATDGVDVPAAPRAPRHERPVKLYADWRFLAPPVAILVLAASWGRDLPALLLAVIAVVLGAAVLAAVHHAEVVAHRVGEPLGSLLLAVAVTVIEVGLIVTLMIAGGAGTASLARDTVFAAVMITTNGIMGLCQPGPEFSPAQLAFAAVARSA